MGGCVTERNPGQDLDQPAQSWRNRQVLVMDHSQREHRELSTVLAMQGSPESKNPIYDACKIFGSFIISRNDYSKGPFYLFISPYFDYTLAPSTSDCVFALRRTREEIQFLSFAAFITHLWVLQPVACLYMPLFQATWACLAFRSVISKGF